MAKGWHKYPDRLEWAELVRQILTITKCRPEHLAPQIGIHKSSLWGILRDKRSLPEEYRPRVLSLRQEVLRDFHQSGELNDSMLGLVLPSAALQVDSLQEVAFTPVVAFPYGVELPTYLASLQGELKATEAEKLGAWHIAEQIWLEEALVAEKSGELERWARCMSNAGILAMDQSGFFEAEVRFKRILARGAEAVGKGRFLDTKVRLGWTYFEQQGYDGAIHEIEPAKKECEAESMRHPDDEYLLGVWHGADHFLGRAQGENITVVLQKGDKEEALANLRKAHEINGWLGNLVDQGWDLLRQAPITYFRDDDGLRKANRLIDESYERIGGGSTARGYIYLQRGIQGRYDRDKRTEGWLRQSQADFERPIYYPRGASDAHRELGLWLSSNGNLDAAFEHVLAAVVLHPYGENLTALTFMAAKKRGNKSQEAFWRYWDGLAERFKAWEGEAFRALRPLAAGGGGSARNLHLQGLLSLAKDEIQRDFDYPYETTRSP